MRRSSGPDWLRPVTERLSPTIRTLVIANAFLFAFYVMVPPAQPLFRNHLALGSSVSAGEAWQLFTSLFVHLDFLSFVFNLLGLWFVGAAIERSVGRTKFLVLFFGPALLANVAMAFVALWLRTGEVFAGCSLAILGTFVVFGRIFDRTPARVFGSLVMEARTLTAILIAFAVLGDLTRLSWASVAGDVVVVLSAYVLSGGRGVGPLQLWRRISSKGGVARRRYQVIDGGRSQRPPFVN